MNGSIASANNATLATVAANYGLKTAVDQHSLDVAARITPLEVTPKWPMLLNVVSAAALASQGTPCCRHFLGGGLAPGRRPCRQGGRKRAGRLALHGGRVGHATKGGHQDSKCPAGSCHQGLRPQPSSRLPDGWLPKRKG